MAAATYLYPMSALPSTTSSSSTSPTPQQPRPPLRRATYVHVSDLTSAYNIDHAQLEQELTRVKTEREERLQQQQQQQQQQLCEEDEEDNNDKKLSTIPVVSVDEDETALVGTSIAPQKRLSPPRGGFNLCALVGTVNVVVDKKRVDQSRVRLAEVEIGDETGTVSLRARDEQIDLLEEVSKRSGAVVLRNCTLELFQGKHIRLAVTKWGKLAVYPDNVASTPLPPSKMNLDRNFSLIDLSIVASEMVDTKPSTESSYAHRQSKTPEAERGGGCGGGNGGPSPSRASTTKSAQNSTKQQQSQSSRRNSRSSDRRQSRGKGQPGPPMGVHYGGIKPDTMQPQPGQMMYHSMTPYSGYDQSMGIRQFSHSYTHASRQQELSAQQLMLQQQFEMQQRQLHQMYSAQQDSHRQGQHSQTPQMLLRPMGSFETASNSYAGDISDQHQASMMAGVGTTSLVMPMGMTGASGIAASPQEHYASPKLDSHSAGHDSSQRQSGAMSPFPLGKMNPDATAYAPSYVSAAQGPASQQAQTPTGAPQFPYDFGAMYTPQSGHHLGFYTPVGMTPTGMMYPAIPQHETAGTATTSDDVAKIRQHPPAASPGTTDSAASGKENVTS